jgi:molybdopterin biosynthesis enzyme
MREPRGDERDEHHVTADRIPWKAEEDGMTASVHTHQGSGNIHSMVAHNGLTLLPPDTDAEPGDIIDALWCR